MRLGLSSAVAPEASLDELLVACGRRGLEALELRAGDWHGVDRADDPLGAAVQLERAIECGVAISAYLADESGHDLRLARLSEALRAPVLMSAAGQPDVALRRAADLAAVGGRSGILLSGTESNDSLERILAADVDIGWQADPAEGPLGARGARLLERCGRRLRHVRLVGGGPEAALADGQGVGELMGRLALAGFDGSVVLVPSSSRYRLAWASWLGRRGGWGCGSKTADAALVRLVDDPMMAEQNR